MFTLSSRSNPITLSVKLNGCPTTMELDTGASLSVMGDSTLKALLGDSVSITPSDVTLRTYTGEELPVLGQVDVTVTYESQVISLPLIIIQGKGVTLFGRNWLEHIQVGLVQDSLSEKILVVCSSTPTPFSRRAGYLKRYGSNYPCSF